MLLNFSFKTEHFGANVVAGFKIKNLQDWNHALFRFQSKLFDGELSIIRKNIIPLYAKHWSMWLSLSRNPALPCWYVFLFRFEAKLNFTQIQVNSWMSWMRYIMTVNKLTQFFDKAALELYYSTQTVTTLLSGQLYSSFLPPITLTPLLLSPHHPRIIARSTYWRVVRDLSQLFGLLLQQPSVSLHLHFL